jgi:hypothetical protein
MRKLILGAPLAALTSPAYAQSYSGYNGPNGYNGTGAGPGYSYSCVNGACYGTAPPGPQYEHPIPNRAGGYGPNNTPTCVPNFSTGGCL